METNINLSFLNDVMDQVVLVNKKNKKIGLEEKQKAHIEGKLHRAFSVFVFNSKKELLLQQRAKTKYHCGGVWANTCCSHPKPGERYSQATKRRLQEEMGFQCKLKKEFCFIYKAKLNNELTEHEFDCVFTGLFEGIPKPNPEEVMAYRWMKLADIKKDMKRNPKKYAPWFKIAITKLKY